MIKRMRLSILIGITFMCLFLSGCMDNMIYHPSKDIFHTPADIGLSHESVWLETDDGIDIHGWWIPVSGARGTVLFFHGNAGNISHRLDTIRIINQLGLNLFIFDYRGFGKSGGSPSEKGLYLDADAAMYYLAAERKIDPRTIVLWGRSLGGAIAARTAAVHDAGMLILESTFTSMTDVANDHFLWVPGWLLRNHSYNTLKNLAHVDIPVLVIHSPQDEVVSFDHGERLHNSISPFCEFLVIQGSHNQGFLSSINTYISGINDFITRMDLMAMPE